MNTAYVIVALVTIVANAFSELTAMLRYEPVMRRLRPALATAGVPESWLVFPIGTLKTAGAVGLALGLVGVPYAGTAAAIGLVLFFVCAVYTHLRVADYANLYLPGLVFLPLAVATLALDLAR